MSVRIDKQLVKLADRDLIDMAKRVDENCSRIERELLPTGSVIPWWTDLDIPEGWLLCSPNVGGRVLQRGKYKALSIAFNKTFNDGSESDDEFRLPDPDNPLILGVLTAAQVWIVKT